MSLCLYGGEVRPISKINLVFSIFLLTFALMKILIILILIYLSGCVVGYFEGRRLIKSWGFGYSVSDRAKNIGTALFSWVDVAATELMFCTQSIDDKTPAKW